MPHSELHQEKKKKNWTILAMIVAWVVLIFIVTMIKVTHGG